MMIWEIWSSEGRLTAWFCREQTMTMETPFWATSGRLTWPIRRLASRVWKAGGVMVARLTGPGLDGWTLPSAALSASISEQERAERLVCANLLMTAAWAGPMTPFET